MKTSRSFLKYLAIFLCIIFLTYIIFIQKSSKDYIKEKPARDFPIDVVITWLDTSDEKWWEKYQEERKKLSPNEVFTHETPVNEKEVHYPLFLNVLLIKKNMPWIRNIFIFCQFPQSPNWISNLFDNVHVIHHDQIDLKKIDDYSLTLPTYNSMVTCALTSHIPHLAEHYIQTDDDVFVLDKLSPSFFFTKNGKPIFRAESENMKKKQIIYELGRLTGINGGYSHIFENTLSMLNDAYSKSTTSNFYNTNHCFTPCVKSLVQECKRSIPLSKWKALRSIRSKTDFDFYGLYLVSWLIYTHPDRVIVIDNKGIQFIEGDDFEENKINTDTQILCINNSFTKKIRLFLEKYL